MKKHPSIGKAMRVFSSLVFLNPPNLPMDTKIRKVIGCFKSNIHWKNNGWTLEYFEESETKRIQQNEKGPSQIFVGKHLIWKTFKNWKMLPFFAKKTCLSKFCRKICSTSCVLSSPPPKKKRSKNETKIHQLGFKSIPRPDPLEQPVVIITGNTEAPPFSRNSQTWRFFGAPGRTWGGRFFPLPGKHRNSYHFC